MTSADIHVEELEGSYKARGHTEWNHHLEQWLASFLES